MEGSVTTNTQTLGTGWQTSMGRGDVLGQDCILSMSLWCHQHNVWSSQSVQNKMVLPQSLQLAGWSPDTLACENFRDRKILFCARLGAQVSILDYFSCSEGILQNVFSPPISFSHSIATQSGASQPHRMDKLKWHRPYETCLIMSLLKTSMKSISPLQTIRWSWITSFRVNRLALRCFSTSLEDCCYQRGKKKTKKGSFQPRCAHIGQQPACQRPGWGISTKVSKSSSIHFRLAAPPLRCWACTFGLKIKRFCILARNHCYPWIPRAILYFKTCLLIHFIFTHKILAGVSETCGLLERLF